MQLCRKFVASGLFWLWVTLVVIGLDRYSKFWVTHHLSYFEPVQILPIFNLTLSYNTGAAFGFLHHAAGWQNVFLGSLALIVSFIVLCFLARMPARERWMSIGLCCVLGGALGNAWDRSMFGFVVDFLSFHVGDWYFAIFNVADTAICVGAFMICLHWTLQKKS